MKRQEHWDIYVEQIVTLEVQQDRLHIETITSLVRMDSEEKFRIAFLWLLMYSVQDTFKKSIFGQFDSYFNPQTKDIERQETPLELSIRIKAFTQEEIQFLGKIYEALFIGASLMKNIPHSLNFAVGSKGSLAAENIIERTVECIEQNVLSLVLEGRNELHKTSNQPELD